jgi:hypothetical protein
LKKERKIKEERKGNNRDIRKVMEEDRNKGRKN